MSNYLWDASFYGIQEEFWRLGKRLEKHGLIVREIGQEKGIYRCEIHTNIDNLIEATMAGPKIRKALHDEGESKLELLGDVCKK